MLSFLKHFSLNLYFGPLHLLLLDPDHLPPVHDCSVPALDVLQPINDPSVSLGLLFRNHHHVDHEHELLLSNIRQMSQENPFQVGEQLDGVAVFHFLLELCPVNSKLGHVADGLLHDVVEGVHGQVD